MPLHHGLLDSSNNMHLTCQYSTNSIVNFTLSCIIHRSTVALNSSSFNHIDTVPICIYFLQPFTMFHPHNINEHKAGRVGTSATCKAPTKGNSVRHCSPAHSQDSNKDSPVPGAWGARQKVCKCNFFIKSFRAIKLDQFGCKMSRHCNKYTLFFALSNYWSTFIQIQHWQSYVMEKLPTISHCELPFICSPSPQIDLSQSSSVNVKTLVVCAVESCSNTSFANSLWNKLYIEPENWGAGSRLESTVNLIGHQS